MVFGLPADDQRRTGFIDQDRVHFVNDGVIQATLHPVCHLIDHVVTQVVKAVFVVGAVGDVSAVSSLLFFTRHLRQIDAHRHTQKVVELAHPLRIAIGKVIIHRDHMHALTRQRIQVNWQCGC